MVYIFLDKVQNVDDFQRVVDSLLLRDNVDIYLTGFSDDIIWHEVSDITALMQIPYKDEGDEIIVVFGDNGLIEKMEAMRYKGNNPDKSLWEIECIEWADFEGITIP